MTSHKRESIVIYSSRPDTIAEYLRKLYNYRELIWVFALRDLKVKYAQTFLGVGWSLIQPLTAMLVFTFFFGYVLDWTAGEVPYALYVLSGLMAWNFFTYLVNAGASSIQESSALIRKIYFPKSVLPLSKVVVAGAELLLGFLLLLPLMYYHGWGLSWKFLFLPFILLFNAMCGLTLVFWLSSLAYRMRDLYHVLPFIVYFGIWVTPVFFTDTLLPQHLRFILDLNPMSSVVHLWRWMLFSTESFSWVWIVAFIFTCVLFLAGAFHFHIKEGEFSDHA